MKLLSICNRTVLILCLVILCGVAAIIGGSCLSQRSRKTEGNFFEIAGLAPEDVTKVSICYEEVAYELQESNRQRLLDSLQNAQGSMVTYDHEYP